GHCDAGGVAAVGAPLLGAVEHVVVALANGGGLEPGGVRARGRLGERIRAQQLAGREPGQEALLLLVGAGEEDRDAAERLVEILRAGGRARGRDLLAHEGQREGAHRVAPVRLGDPDAVEPGLDEGADRVLRVRLGLVVARGVRRHALARDLSREVTEHPLIVGEIEGLVHARILYRARRRRARRLAAGSQKRPTRPSATSRPSRSPSRRKPPATSRSSVSRWTCAGRRRPRSASSARTYHAPAKSARCSAAQTAGAGAATLTAWRTSTS